MTEIIKYSKEWFAAQQQSKIDAGKKLKSIYDGQDYLTAWKFDPEQVAGSKEEMRDVYNQLKESGARSQNFFSLDNLIDTFGGLDAFLEIMDSDGDGNISVDEAKAVAAADTEEFADEIDTELSAMDLYNIYKNATEAEGAKVEVDGNTTTIKYKDGVTTKIETDENGNIKTKMNYSIDKKKVFTSEQYNYENKTIYESKIDAKGREIYFAVDAPGRVNDTQTTTTYNDKNKTKVEKRETAGRIITTNYDAQGKVIRTSQTLKYNSDGVVGNTEQHDIGDCWVLSGVNAIKGTEEGAKIIKESIKKNSDGSVTVTLKGVNKSYTFTPDQIGAKEYPTLSKQYATGDVDMNLIEMAVNEYRLELLDETTERTGKLSKASEEDPLRSGFLDEALEYLTGKTHKEAWNSEDFTTVLDAKKADINKNAIVVNFNEEDPSFGEDGIITGHAYSVARVTNDKVYVVNPWDSSKEIAYPKDRFLENCKYMASVDLK